MRKIQILFLTAASALLLFSGCGKKDDPEPNNNNNSNNNNPGALKPYFFNYNFDNKDYKINTGEEQYMPFSENEVGGYVTEYVPGPEDIGISFRFDHHPTNQEVLDMAGVTYYYEGYNAPVKLEVSIRQSLNEESIYSIDTLSSIFYVKVNSVKYLKEFESFYYVDVYEMTGTCTALMRKNDGTTALLKNGSFKMAVSRVKEK